MNEDTRREATDKAREAADKARATAESAFEEVKVASNQVVDRVRGLIEEGNVRRVLIKKDGKTLLEVPMTVGVGGAAAIVLLNPVIAAVGALAALVTDITLVVERDDAAAAQQSADAKASAPGQGQDASKPVTDHEGADAARSAGGSDKTIGR